MEGNPEPDRPINMVHARKIIFQTDIISPILGPLANISMVLGKRSKGPRYKRSNDNNRPIQQVFTRFLMALPQTHTL